MDATLRRRIDELPRAPGVYLMKDRAGAILYVGKAVDLRARVRSYFQEHSSDTRAFVALLDGLLDDLEVIVVHSEKEALILENTLIKRHKPRFNVLLRDDKQFIVLRLDVNAPHPRLEVRRKIEADGARWFGPFSSASAIRETLQVANRHFQLRTCTDAVLASRRRPCLLHQIGRCPAPCVLEIDRDEYARNVRELALFLSGREPELVEELRGRMRAHAAALRYEAAAGLRDRIHAIERSLERQRTVLPEAIDQDVIGVHREHGELSVAVMQVRQGRLIGARTFGFSGQEFPTAELLASLVPQLYEAPAELPEELLLPVEPTEAAVLVAWLEERRGGRVKLLVPQRGDRRSLVEMAEKNAAQAAAERKLRGPGPEETLRRLQALLGLSRLPRRIECYDISNFQGSMIVASGVAFADGEPEKARYRRYRITSTDGQDDFRSMYEVISRRVRRGLDEGTLPELLLIDGGKGQLGAAHAAVKDCGALDRVELASIAKSRVDGVERSGGVTRSPERLFRPGWKEPVAPRASAPELLLCARIRDEAHRFAIDYHRKLRGAGSLHSVLEEIPGVGDARRRTLLRHFGSLSALRAATQAQLAEVEGVGPALAATIATFLREQGGPEGARALLRAAEDSTVDGVENGALGGEEELPSGVEEALLALGEGALEEVLRARDSSAPPGGGTRAEAKKSS